VFTSPANVFLEIVYLVCVTRTLAELCGYVDNFGIGQELFGNGNRNANVKVPNHEFSKSSEAP
jgi:hypothetical protein